MDFFKIAEELLWVASFQVLSSFFEKREEGTVHGGDQQVSVVRRSERAALAKSERDVRTLVEIIVDAPSCGAAADADRARHQRWLGRR